MQKVVQSVTEKVNYIEDDYLLSCEIVNGNQVTFTFCAGYNNGNGQIFQPKSYDKKRLLTYIQLLTALSKAL